MSIKGRENTYSFKGGDVIEMLKTLKLQFEDQLKELNSAEASASNAHKLADAAKEDEIQAAERAKETKTEVKGAKGSVRRGYVSRRISRAETQMPLRFTEMSIFTFFFRKGFFYIRSYLCM